jgi:hypothetical protein
MLSFVFAAGASIWSIWRAVAHYAGDIAKLRRAVSVDSEANTVTVTFLEPVLEPVVAREFAPMHVRRPHRYAGPKAFRHRLHQFARAAA